MTPDQLEQRREIIAELRRIAADESVITYGMFSDKTAQVLVEMLDEARFVAESFTQVLDPYTEMYYEHAKNLAHGLVVAIDAQPLRELDEDFDQPEITVDDAYELGFIDGQDSLQEYEVSDNVLEHVEANDYTLKPEYTSAWVAVDTLAVYICRMNSGLLVEVHPNNDEAAGRPYAKSFVEFEPKE